MYIDMLSVAIDLFQSQIQKAIMGWDCKQKLGFLQFRKK